MDETNVKRLKGLLNNQIQLSNMLTSHVAEMRTEQMVLNQTISYLLKQNNGIQTRMERIELRYTKKSRHFSIREVLLKLQTKVFKG